MSGRTPWDGSICYAEIDAHGQGDTEEEALLMGTMALFLDHQPDRFKVGQAAQDELTELIAELTSDGVTPWVRQVVPCRNLVSA